MSSTLEMWFTKLLLGDKLLSTKKFLMWVTQKRDFIFGIESNSIGHVPSKTCRTDVGLGCKMKTLSETFKNSPI